MVVAVGLAAIRPLKQRARTVFLVNGVRCSGFGRYQAVETPLLGQMSQSLQPLQWVWPLSGR